MDKDKLRKIVISDLTYGEIDGYFLQFLIVEKKDCYGEPYKEVKVLAELSNGKINTYPIGRIKFND